MNSQCPRSLFKYFGHPLWPKELSLENSAFKLLKERSIKVTPPSHFNDPFEFSPTFDRVPSSPEVAHRVRSVIGVEASSEGLPTKHADDLSDVLISLKSTPQEQTYCGQQSILPLLSTHFGVICFSAVDRDHLMWAHYGAQHRGVLLEFDTTAPLFANSGFVKVDYVPQRCIISPKTGSEFDQVKFLASRKSPCWSYEQEYRIVIPLEKTRKICTNQGEIYLLNIEPDWIKSITVGCLASFETKNEIQKFVRRPEFAHLKSQRFRIIRHNERFEFERQRITAF